MSDMERIFSALERIEEAHNQLAVQVHAVSVCLDRSVPRRPALSPVYFLTSHSLAHRTTTESPRSSARSTRWPTAILDRPSCTASFRYAFELGLTTVLVHEGHVPEPHQFPTVTRPRQAPPVRGGIVAIVCHHYSAYPNGTTAVDFIRPVRNDAARDVPARQVRAPQSR